MIIDNHYIAIKSLGTLLASENSKHKRKEYFCINCLQEYHQKNPRDEHLRYYLDNETVKVEMPHKKPIVEFAMDNISLRFLLQCMRTLNPCQNQFKVPTKIQVDLGQL